METKLRQTPRTGAKSVAKTIRIYELIRRDVFFGNGDEGFVVDIA